MLGPGNGNDIELAKLTHQFEKVALVDLDEAAVARAVSRLIEEGVGRIRRYSPVDLSGMLPELESWRHASQPSDDAEISAVMRSAMAAPRPEVGSFDVVASTCMLTQLIDSVYMALPTEHPRCDELVMAVRNRHLEIMLEMLNPGGVGVLVTDFVAAETAPELAQLDELLLPRMAAKWIEERNSLRGPIRLRFEIITIARAGRGRGRGCASEGPWRWDIGAKQLAVCAVTFRRSRV